MKTFIILVSVLMFGCATKNEVKELELGKLDVKGQALDGTIGINEKNVAVIREERTVQDELRIMDMVNMHLHDEVRRNLFDLKSCRKDMSDPRLGGDGTVPRDTDLDSLEDQIEKSEEMGLDEESGDLKIVREISLNDKLKLEKKREKTYRQVIKLSARHLEECEAKMAVARRKSGLPSKRIEGNGYHLNDGTYIQTHRNERDLDDAFEMKSINERRAPASEKNSVPSAQPKSERQQIEEKVDAMFDEDRG